MHNSRKIFFFRAWAIVLLWLVDSGLDCCVVRAADRPATRGGGAHGFSYQHDEIPSGPWSIHIIRVNRGDPRFELHSSLASGNQFGLTTLSEQLRTIPAQTGRPVAAINGDYYNSRSAYTGDPKGLQIMRGELVSAPRDWTCFWVQTNGSPQMGTVISQFEVTWPNGTKTPFGLNEQRNRDQAVLYTSVVGASSRTSGGLELILEHSGEGLWLPLCAGQNYVARVREIRKRGDSPIAPGTLVLSLGPNIATRVPAVTAGATLGISTATSPALGGVKTAIGGGPALIRSGKSVPLDEANVRHPRAALGWNHDTFFFVEVDGRQLDLSVGMTFSELSDYMLKLGCDEAMSLDGGGSATCWVYGHVMNNPSEGRERGMANALVLMQVEKEKK